MKAALLGGDRFAADVLRGLKAAFLNEEVAQNKRDEGLAEDEYEKIVAREVKKRAESIKLYEENSRPELAEDEKNETAVLVKYLPKQLSEDEIVTVIEQVIAETNASGMQAMGMVIKTVKEKLGNSADGATVARIVKEKLQ